MLIQDELAGFYVNPRALFFTFFKIMPGGINTCFGLNSGEVGTFLKLSQDEFLPFFNGKWQFLFHINSDGFGNFLIANSGGASTFVVANPVGVGIVFEARLGGVGPPVLLQGGTANQGANI